MGTPPFPQQVIARKRDGEELDRGEIEAFVRGAADGSWADYQLSALLMAVFLRGMTPRETAVLTEAMMRSGTVADLSAIRAPKADKHSTGGVGDKVSLHLAPMVAACGVVVPMISGRGLGHTGGTVDKLESIPGFRVALSIAEFRAQLGKIGLALISQTAEIVPADRKLYALRDVTATVESIPLICASILSKKLAEGIDVLVLDVKHGRGAFMKDKARARELAVALTSVARAMGKPARAVMTAMDEPLGHTVGNALEVAESVECLRGSGPADLMEVTHALGGQMLVLAGTASGAEDARVRLERSVSSGAALAKFREMVAAQGGDPRVADDPSVLPAARIKAPVPSPSDGWIRSVDALGIALAALRLGAGRARAGDAIDPAVGVAGLVKVGQRAAKGQPLCVAHANDQGRLAEAHAILARAIVVGPDPAPEPARVGEVIG
ncbi:MAG TPA: thymidine phosphorylase [Opitutaceae bacterium]|nr:thymidine phosphorylase [Opitutaceae bacterium]